MSTKLRMDVVVTRVLEWLGAIYSTWGDALLEYLDNAVDADAQNIWVVLTPESISVIDDGHGMNGPMYPEDLELLKLYKEGLEKNTIKDEDDIRSMVNLSSLRSLQWMAEAVGLSAKVYDPKHPRRGTKGIGTLAFRLMGEQAFWVSRPSADVAGGRTIQTWMFVPPSNDDLHAGSSEYQLPPESSVPLTDPSGSLLESGTMVHITNLIADPARHLQPTYLLERLVGRFGDAASRGVNIFLIDRMTKEGQAVRGGIIHKVSPRRYKGLEAYVASHSLGRGAAPFAVELYFDPDGRGHRPMIRRHGSDVSPLTSIHGLNIPPFNSGKISGYVEFPNLSDTEAPWNADKTAPLESKPFQEWQAAVLRVAEHLAESVSEIRQRAQDEHLERVAHKLSEVAQDVLRESPLFEGLVRPVETTRRRVVPRGRRRTTPHNRTEVVVQNLNRQGIPGLTVSLFTLAGKPLWEKVTGVTGQVSFGELEHGQYMVVVSGVPDITNEAQLTKYFRLTALNPRERVVFRLDTDIDIPQVNKIPGNVVISPRPLPDSTQPWDISRLMDGFLIINTEYYPMKVALDEHDMKKQLYLTTQYVAAAIGEFLYKEAPFATLREVLVQVTEFFINFMDSVQGLEKDPELTGKRRKRR